LSSGSANRTRSFELPPFFDSKGPSLPQFSWQSFIAYTHDERIQNVGFSRVLARGLWRQTLDHPPVFSLLSTPDRGCIFPSVLPATSLTGPGCHNVAISFFLSLPSLPCLKKFFSFFLGKLCKVRTPRCLWADLVSTYHPSAMRLEGCPITLGPVLSLPKLPTFFFRSTSLPFPAVMSGQLSDGVFFFSPSSTLTSNLFSFPPARAATA